MNILDKPEIELKTSYSNRAFKNGLFMLFFLIIQFVAPILYNNWFKINIHSNQFFAFSIVILIGVLWFGPITFISMFKSLKEPWTIKKVFGILFSLIFLAYILIIFVVNGNDLMKGINATI